MSRASMPETTTVPQTTTDIQYLVVPDEELEKPFRVMIENDDITPMEFVVLVLRSIFRLSTRRAEMIMLQAHYNGVAHVVTLPFSEAQQKVYEAHSLARASGYPLSFYLEPEES